jgi:hypothetical protein
MKGETDQGTASFGEIRHATVGSSRSAESPSPPLMRSSSLSILHDDRSVSKDSPGSLYPRINWCPSCSLCSLSIKSAAHLTSCQLMPTRPKQWNDDDEYASLQHGHELRVDYQVWRSLWQDLVGVVLVPVVMPAELLYRVSPHSSWYTCRGRTILVLDS